MAYVVTEQCIKCKYMDCVAVCPVDCFYEGDVMLAIRPTECIDCGACELECPPRAIVSGESIDVGTWGELNARFSRLWPNVTRKGQPPPDADLHCGEPDKYRKYFSPAAVRDAAPSQK